ncbi:phage head closure protein [Kushneria phosphatilytica]|uniref:Phage head closure protein n=1 Tax=Kushneria phosphatilytica TaxID=657387 RepID=A0A1S1NX19_9GAMM|nr:phage head closure protein [Kushneria phosphatilytica]OHV12122.1 hypothetical protein BH688_05575 [Kushneria phosphatilytica]QEL11316.1 phage head closure protein [Kushneria phosphatilytica]
MRAGKLSHRVNIEEKQMTQNPETGAMEESWAVRWGNVPASIEPLSAREFVASQAVSSQVTARVVIRWRPGIKPTMRVVHTRRGERHIYNIEGQLPDEDSGMEYVTLPVSRGADDAE